MSAPRTPEDVDRLFGEYMNAGDIEGLLCLSKHEPVEARGGGSVRRTL